MFGSILVSTDSLLAAFSLPGRLKVAMEARSLPKYFSGGNQNDLLCGRSGRAA